MQETLNTKKLKYFTDLIAWKEGHKLVLMIYKETELFPKEEEHQFPLHLIWQKVLADSLIKKNLSFILFP
jgi:hypothetical protein